MRFKEFIDIDSLRHAKIDEKPVKNYNGDYKNLVNRLKEIKLKISLLKKQYLDKF